MDQISFHKIQCMFPASGDLTSLVRRMRICPDSDPSYRLLMISMEHLICMEVEEPHSKCEEILFQKAGGTNTQSYTVSHLSHRDEIQQITVYRAYWKQIPFVITVKKKILLVILHSYACTYNLSNRICDLRPYEMDSLFFQVFVIRINPCRPK